VPQALSRHASSGRAAPRDRSGPRPSTGAAAGARLRPFRSEPRTLLPLHHATLPFRGPPRIAPRHDLASALVSLPGALLFAAVRGGIPVIFPQFAERGLLRRHGFARQLDWSFAGIADGSAVFELRDSAATAEWPHAFACRLSIAPGPSRLAVALEVENLGSDA